MAVAITETRLPGQRELALLAGFVDPTKEPRHGERKQAALMIRCRIAATELGAVAGPKIPFGEVALRCGATDRTIRNHFRTREALFAFPPPEMATAMVRGCRGCKTALEMLARLRLLFVALDENDEGRNLMKGLAHLHRTCPTLGSSDGHFLSQLRLLVISGGETAEQARPIAALFTEALRQSFSTWSVDPTNSTLEVLDRTVAIVGACNVYRLIMSAPFAPAALTAS